VSGITHQVWVSNVVSVFERLPVHWIDPFRHGTRMVQRESDRKFACAEVFEHLRATGVVIEIRPPAAGRRQSNGVPYGRERPRHGPEVGLSLADVMQKCCFCAGSRIGTTLDVERVPLVFHSLGEECRRQRGRQLIPDVLLFGWLQRLRCDEPKEAANQMHYDEVFVLQSMHLDDVGLYSMRSSPISLPQSAHLPKEPSSTRPIAAMTRSR